jgi:hypothetical protein
MDIKLAMEQLPHPKINERKRGSLRITSHSSQQFSMIDIVK